MNEIISSAIWSPVRLLDKNEFASGGANGNMNEHAIALANRTHFLKEIIDELKNEVARLNEHVENCNCSGESEPGYPLNAISVEISPDLQYSVNGVNEIVDGNVILWNIEVNNILYLQDLGWVGYEPETYVFLEDYLEANQSELGIMAKYEENEITRKSSIRIYNITNKRKFVRLIPHVPYISRMYLTGNPTAKIDSDGVISFWLEPNNEVQIPDDGESNEGAFKVSCEPEEGQQKLILHKIRNSLPYLTFGNVAFNIYIDGIQVGSEVGLSNINDMANLGLEVTFTDETLRHISIINTSNVNKAVGLIPTMGIIDDIDVDPTTPAVIQDAGIHFCLAPYVPSEEPEGTVHYDLNSVIHVLNNPNIIYGVIRKYIGINSQWLFLVRFDLKEEVDTSTLECRYFLPLKASSQIDNFLATDTPNGVILNTWSDGVNVDLIRDTGTSIGYEDILPISQAYSLHNYIPLPFSNKFISPLSNGNPSGFYFCTLENGQMSGSLAFQNSFYGNVYNRSLTKLLIKDAPAYLHNQSIYTITESGIEKTASIPMKDVYDSITDYWGPVALASTSRYGLILNRSNSISQRVLQIVDFGTLEMKFIDVTEYTANSRQYIYASDDLSKIVFGSNKRSKFIEIEYDYASNSILSSRPNTQSFYMSNDAKFRIEPIIQESKPYLKLSNDISESAIYSLEDLLTIY